MRTIKFRGKCIDETTDNGKWIVGSLLQDDNGIFMIVCFVDHHEQWYRVDPDTVGQYTGIIDKNGKEIYEGDIITKSHGIRSSRHMVLYYPYTASFVAKLVGTHDCSNIGQDWVIKYCTAVIGNRFDNPELSEGGKA